MRPEGRPLLETRSADRIEMAREVWHIARRCGCSADIEAVTAREIWVKVRCPGGLRITVDFDGYTAQPGTHVLSWYMPHDCPGRLAPGAFQSVNTSHQRKATDIVSGFDPLCRLLERRFKAARDGSAYQKG